MSDNVEFLVGQRVVLADCGWEGTVEGHGHGRDSHLVYVRWDRRPYLACLERPNHLLALASRALAS